MPITFELVGDYLDEEEWFRLMNWRRRFGRVRKLIRIMRFIIIFGRRFFSKMGPNGSNPDEDSDEWVINDPTLLDSAIVELRKATAKYTTVGIMMNLMKSVLGFPETRRIEHRLVKLTFLASLRLPELVLVRDLFKAIPQYVESNELSESEASQLLDTWQSFDAIHTGCLLFD